MLKFVVLFAILAIAAARPSGSELVYAAGLPTSGYEYTHTVQAPDYVNHVSVSAPLNGLARSYSAPLLQTVYSAPVGYQAPLGYQAW